MLSFTGERVVPGLVEPDLWNEHVSRYQFAAQFAAGKNVLDVGCGSGYGAILLAACARHVTAFDNSPEAIAYAASTPYDRLSLAVGCAAEFPIADHSCQLVTAFEVIEHLESSRALVEEAGRVLVDGGLFLVSTPNKSYYAETRATVGKNPYHMREFEFVEFQELLREVFPFVSILSQNHVEAIAFSGQVAHGAAYCPSDITSATKDAHFYLAACSARDVCIPLFLYAGKGGNLLREREAHIRILESDLAKTRSDYKRLEEEFDKASLKLGAAAGSRWIRLGRLLGLGPPLE